TGSFRLHISARFAPLPPSKCFSVRSPSAPPGPKPYTCCTARARDADERCTPRAPAFFAVGCFFSVEVLLARGGFGTGTRGGFLRLDHLERIDLPFPPDVELRDRGAGLVAGGERDGALEPGAAVAALLNERGIGEGHGLVEDERVLFPRLGVVLAHELEAD